LIECRNDIGVLYGGLHQGFETVFRFKHGVPPIEPDNGSDFLVCRTSREGQVAPL
jgi:hypothetical protein